MPIDRDKQRQFAEEVVERLRGAGYEALWAGGCVRDALLGLTPKDYDVATSATPDEVRKVFGKRRTIPVGVAFGVMTVLGPKSAGQIEVATFRTEGAYSDGRRPDSVKFATAELDSGRRDFTINGLFFDPIAGDVIDYVGGQADLEAGVVRAIGDADARIVEDKLRMLRAVRFAARFGFTIEPATEQAVRCRGSEIVQVSGERIGAEMRAMLMDTNRARALELLRTTQLEPHVLPELAEVDNGAFQELLVVVRSMEDPTLAMVLAALMRGEVGVRIAGSLARRWKLPNRDASRADWLLDKLSTIAAARSVPWPQLQRVLVHEGALELVALAAAIAGTEDPAVKLCRAKLALPMDELNPAPLVTGDDFIHLGIAPCPEFGTWLETIRDAQIEGQIRTREEALRMVRVLSEIE
ncbi:MAG: CCA tRNA nucleotidyltransferase [Aeoliella sp.]